MKIGDYIRINNGQIAKITKIKEYKKWSNIIYTDIAIDLHEDRACNDNFIDEEEIIKTSPNIIDLIEVGDYVNGHKVVEVDLDDIDDYGNDFRYIKAEHDYTLNYWIKENEIESVLTKEQFESMEYRIGE